jgi:hypothetical protein
MSISRQFFKPNTAFLRQLVPPLIWELLRKMLGKRTLDVLPAYQGIVTPARLPRLHTGSFSNIHERWAALDLHINSDTNVTRLRVYTACIFAKIAQANTQDGDFLSAGISYGTAPLIIAEYLQLEKIKGLKYYLIDPFSGAGRTNYNTDIDLVKSRWNNNISTIWIRQYLSIKAIDEVGRLGFIHLNTGDFDSEFKTLPLLYNLLLPGGFIVQDLYGWQSIEKQLAIDTLLLQIGAESFVQVTQQLIIYKPFHSAPD